MAYGQRLAVLNKMREASGTTSALSGWTNVWYLLRVQRMSAVKVPLCVARDVVPEKDATAE